MWPRSLSCMEQSRDLAAAASSMLDLLFAWFFFQAVRQVQIMLLVWVSDLKLVEAARATLGPTGLGCPSDPAAFCNSVGDWYEAEASTASNPKPPRLNLAAKDNSRGTRAAVGRSVHPPSLEDASVLIQSMSSHSKPLKTKTSVPEIKSSWSMSLHKMSDNPYTEQAAGIRCSMPERWTRKVSIAYSWHLLLAEGWVESSESAPGIQNPPLSQQTSAQSLKTVWLLLYHHFKIWSSRSVKQVAAIKLCC